ncbi:hypothetical protein LPU83_pLPU83c_0468 (plasmid) [Rhizobium favelukesii]|uniref:Uncharacterized protein n=1 Tax=Rhizobium favelukesii TaxID=348824 RepID=W6RLB4_9HYPH|nr:hypothetical protein LPU83_pLPU83c_0468 [Rhizobium favelukesii]
MPEQVNADARRADRKLTLTELHVAFTDALATKSFPMTAEPTLR